MNGNSRRRSPGRSSGDRATHSREALERLARILVSTGHSPRHLAREFRDICGRLREPTRTWDARQSTYLWDLPHIIAHWHADPQYIDAQGAPLPLRLRAQGPSLTALIKRVLPREKPEAVAESLTKLQGVRKRGGLYVPSGRYHNYSRASAWVHGFTALLGMLRTVEHNVAPRRRSQPILERTAVNPSFPASELPSFHRKLKAEAERILWRMDEHMRRREILRRDGPRVRVGVGIFAFEEPRARQGPTRRGARSKRA